MVKTLAKLHDVNPSKVNLDTFGKPGNYFERQVNRWSTQYRASETQLNSDMDWTIDWLKANLVADDGQLSIVHGDYRLDNVMFGKETVEMIAVLDWELSTLGDGLADLGYLCQDYHGDAYNDEGLASADLESLGIPTEDEFVAEYCKHAGLDGIDNWSFYLIYNMFRSAGIIQGVYKRGLDGNASSEKALEYVDAARLRSERGWALVNAK